METGFDKDAVLIKTLMWYDGPQIVLLRTNRDLDMIAYPIPDDNIKNWTSNFFACSMTKDISTKYFDCTYDLNYIFRNSKCGLYIFDWMEMDNDDKIPLRLATDNEIDNENFYPLPGVFATSHDDYPA